MSHLTDRKMIYRRHMLGALEFSWACILAAGKAGIHAIYPEWFTTTSEELTARVTDIHRRAEAQE